MSTTTTSHTLSQSFLLYRKLLGHYRGPFLFWIVVLSAVYLYGLVPPYLVGLIADKVAQGSVSSSLIVGLGVSWAVVSLLRLTAKTKASAIGIHLQHEARSRALDRLLAFPMEWHQRESSGSRMIRIEAGTKALRDGTTLFSDDILPLLIQSVGVISFFVAKEVVLALFCIVYLVLFGAIQYFFQLQQMKGYHELNALRERSGGFFYEGASNVATIKSTGAVKNLQRFVQDHDTEVRKKSIALNSIGYTKWKAFQILNACFLSLFVWITAVRIHGGSLSLGSLFPFFIYWQKLSESAGHISGFMDRIIEIYTGITRLLPLFDDTLLPVTQGASAVPATWSSLRFEKLSYTYPKKEIPALHSFSWTVQRGSKVGIVGASGSGKSTLIKMLIGLLAPKEGDISLDVMSLSNLAPDERTHLLSVVPQESELFNFSLRENITLFREVSPEVLFRAITIAQLDEVIERLPQGLETPLGEKGSVLSGGERQRVAIARALCRSPQILILDESTSALDSDTESRVMKGVFEELHDSTIIIVAHRLDTLRNTQNIIVLQEGRVVEEGSFSELLQQQGKFNSLYSPSKKLEFLPL